MKKKVVVAFFKETISAPGAGIGGESTLNAEKFTGIEMFTGIEGGFLTVWYRGKEIGVPLSNVRSLVWEEGEVTKK